MKDYSKYHLYLIQGAYGVRGLFVGRARKYETVDIGSRFCLKVIPLLHSPPPQRYSLLYSFDETDYLA